MNSFALFQLSRGIIFVFLVFLSVIAASAFLKLPVKRKVSKILVEVLLVVVVFTFALVFKVMF